MKPLLVCFGFLSGLCQAPDGFADGGRWDDRFYQTFSEELTWDDAKQGCEDRGTTLAIFENMEHAQGIHSLFGKHTYLSCHIHGHWH